MTTARPRERLRSLQSRSDADPSWRQAWNFSFFSRFHGGSAAVAVIALLLGASNAIAQVGLFDPSWRPGGRVLVPTPGSQADLTSIRASGSRWMLGGGCTLAAGKRGCAIRLTANGEVDTTYGDPFQGNAALSELAGLAGGDSYVARSDAAGQIWFARNAPNGTPISVARINATGTAATNPPQTFHFASGSLRDFASDLVFAPDGSTYVIGSVGLDSNNSDFAIARLTLDLQLDPTFNGSGVRTIGFDSPELGDDGARAAAVQPDGRLVVAGTSSRPLNDVRTIWVVRLLNDGSLDPSFGLGGRFRIGASPRASVGAVALDAQGRILIAGVREFTVGNLDGFVIRLTPEGFFDTSFGDAGGAALGFNLVQDGVDRINEVVIQPDEKILLGGYAQRASSSGFFVSARLTSNGVYDPSFGAGGVSFGTFSTVPIPSNSDDTITAMALDNQGRLMVAGYHFDGTRERFGVGRIVTGVVIDHLFADGFE